MIVFVILVILLVASTFYSQTQVAEIQTYLLPKVKTDFNQSPFFSQL